MYNIISIKIDNQAYWTGEIYPDTITLYHSTYKGYPIFDSEITYVKEVHEEYQYYYTLFKNEMENGEGRRGFVNFIDNYLLENLFIEKRVFKIDAGEVSTSFYALFLKETENNDIYILSLNEDFFQIHALLTSFINNDLIMDKDYFIGEKIKATLNKELTLSPLGETSFAPIQLDKYSARIVIYHLESLNKRSSE